MTNSMRYSKKRSNENSTVSEDDALDDKEIEKIVCDYCSDTKHLSLFEVSRSLDCHTIDGVVVLGK
ncbi:hypothetical protein BX616_003837, partial [Lobosporangium transversale]